MKIINETIKKIILDEDDCIEVCTLKGNKSRVFISLKNGAIHISDIPLDRINNLKEEEMAIEAMKKYQKSNPKKK